MEASSKLSKLKGTADLSSDIHLARGDSELFERARMIITEHFEARRLFKLPESAPLGNNPI